MTVLDLLDQFLTEKRITRSKSLLKNYRVRLRYFRIYTELKKIQSISDLNENFFSRYTQFLKRKKFSTNTLYVYLDAICAFLHWLYNNSYTLVNYAPLIQKPKWDKNKRHYHIEKEAFQIYVDSIQETGIFKIRNTSILALYVLEELSTRAITNLTLLDLELDMKLLRISSGKRFVKIQPQTIIFLKKYIHSREKLYPKTDYLFVRHGGQKLGSQGTQLVMRRAIEYKRKQKS